MRLSVDPSGAHDTMHGVQNKESGWSRKSDRLPRRRVFISPLVRGGRTRLWAYSYADLALLFGMSEDAVRQSVSARTLDPSSLESVLAFANRKRKR